MEYAIMLSEPDLVSGLQDLLADQDPAVVKRTIRVFANVYRHALTLLAKGDLEEKVFIAAWPAVKGVAEKLMNMLSGAEHEGIIIHIVRFLEAALVAHLISDISRYPDIDAEGIPIVSKGIDTITDLLTTPYVGGSSFIVAMRAIITVACYKPDIREDVVSLIEKQISSPPPTLFDHNVRSLNKILQRNLFRLLRRATTPELRSRLIEMMVTVGVPRRLLAQWAPPQEARKRSAQVLSNDDIISGRNTPPNKRLRNDASSDDGRSTPTNDSREIRDPRLLRQVQETEEPGLPKDPRLAAHQEDIREARSSKSKSSTPQHSPPHDLQPSYSEKPQSTSNSPCTSGRSTPVRKDKTSSSEVSSCSMANFEFLKNLISSTKETKAANPFLQKCTEKERALYERLDHPSVLELVLSCLECVPDSPPDSLLTQLGYSGGDVEGIREHLTTILAPHIPKDFINSLTPPHESSSLPTTDPSVLSRPSSTSSASTAFSCRSSPPPSNPRESSPPSPPSSSRSTPSDPNQLCISDVDLRQFLDKGFSSSGDVDMRRGDPRRGARDSRSSKLQNGPRHESGGSSRNSPLPQSFAVGDSKTTADPRVPQNYSNTLETEQRTSIAKSSIIDPRITMNNPRTLMHDIGDQRRDGFMENMNPGLPKPFSDAMDPRLSFPPLEPPFMMNEHAFLGTGPNPRMGMPNGPFNPNFNNKFGMHCGMNQPDPRMPNVMPGMNFGKGLMGSGPVSMPNRLGPMNGPRFIGGPGIFGPGPRPNMPVGNGPWQNMMPMQTNGPALYSPAPPMHL